MKRERLAVLFPGIGYHCDKPLLYYSAKLAREKGWQVLTVPYGGFPERVRGDVDKMKRCVEMACDQAEAMLSEVRWTDYERLLFIGKSIGTLVGARYACQHDLKIYSLLLTPLEETFRFTRGEAAAFHGTADPWADTAGIRSACRERGIPLYLTEGANHSLETGNAIEDIRILGKTLERAGEWMGRWTGEGNP